MSDIRIYTAANMPDSPLTGDVVICSEAFNSAPANSVHLATVGGADPIWKSFQSDGVAEVFENSFGVDLTNNSYFVLPDGGTYTISGNKSFSAWIKPVSGTSHYLWGYSPNYFSAYLDSSNLHLRAWDSSGTRTQSALSTPVTISNGSWYNIVLTGDGSTTKLYVNGQAGGTATDAGEWRAETFFRAGSSGVYFNGYADEYAFFDSVLSAQNASDIYGSGTPSSLSDYNPVMYARFGDGQSVTSGDDIATVPNSSPATGNALSAASVTDKPSYLDLTGETISV